MSTWRPAQSDPPERPPRRVSASLDVVTAAMGAPPSDVMASVFRHWEAIVGPEIAAHAVPTSLRGGVLVVKVDQPAWASQLRYLTDDLRQRIEFATRAGAVNDIQIRVAGEDRRGTGWRRRHGGE